MEYLIGVDIGTGGTKTVLFDRAGEVVASAMEEYPLYQPENGWAEQEPGDWWQATARTIRRVLTESGVAPGDVKGVGLSGQMHGLVLLDEAGKVLRRAILWCDQRTAGQVEEMNSLAGPEKWMEITANPAMTGFTAAKILWVRQHEPELFARAAHLLLPKDYVRYELTGAFATEVSDASGTQLLDVPHRRWSGELLELLDIDPALLPQVFESPEITGAVTAQAAALTGLQEGTPVVGGAGDNAAAAVGTGVVRDGLAFTTLGTSGVVFAHTDQLTVDPQGRVHSFCCAVPGAWHVMGVTQAAGLSLKWFRENLCPGESYAQLDELAAGSPIGGRRLLYLPYLMGERTPHLDPDCRGVFFGLSNIHGKADMVRAVMEGVAFSQRDSVEVLRGMGISLTDMTACGGGGSSPLWRQMLADVFGCPVRTVAGREGGALGVAILAGVGVGLYPSVQEACAQMIRYQQAQAPIPENVPKYEKFYRLYTRLYPALRESWKELAKL